MGLALGGLARYFALGNYNWVWQPDSRMMCLNNNNIFEEKIEIIIVKNCTGQLKLGMASDSRMMCLNNHYNLLMIKIIVQGAIIAGVENQNLWLCA